jgi:hypothetical protein
MPRMHLSCQVLPTRFYCGLERTVPRDWPKPGTLAAPVPQMRHQAKTDTAFNEVRAHGGNAAQTCIYG